MCCWCQSYKRTGQMGLLLPSATPPPQIETLWFPRLSDLMASWNARVAGRGGQGSPSPPLSRRTLARSWCSGRLPVPPATPCWSGCCGSARAAWSPVPRPCLSRAAFLYVVVVGGTSPTDASTCLNLKFCEISAPSVCFMLSEKLSPVIRALWFHLEKPQ